MSAKAQRELIKRGPGAVAKSAKVKQQGNAAGIPANDHTERDEIVARLTRGRNDC
ncbi:hypothetical protein P3F83_23570 [Mycobacteroides immunogenum]|uniref:hypothetical protein n=1 Tax=Mycobacteroides immunogenum TaxID=83262 RepID=UPI0025B776BC|nr:hypothetical protein [Mycobacteroides immunogenum]WJR33391.1 hypothetical protein P3F83_23570 [Mycobacteroides immunogenum]